MHRDAYIGASILIVGFIKHYKLAMYILEKFIYEEKG